MPADRPRTAAARLLATAHRRGAASAPAPAATAATAAHRRGSTAAAAASAAASAAAYGQGPGPVPLGGTAGSARGRAGRDSRGGAPGPAGPGPASPGPAGILAASGTIIFRGAPRPGTAGAPRPGTAGVPRPGTADAPASALAAPSAAPPPGGARRLTAVIEELDPAATLDFQAFAPAATMALDVSDLEPIAPEAAIPESIAPEVTRHAFIDPGSTVQLSAETIAALLAEAAAAPEPALAFAPARARRAVPTYSPALLTAPASAQTLVLPTAPASAQTLVLSTAPASAQTLVLSPEQTFILATAPTRAPAPMPTAAGNAASDPRSLLAAIVLRGAVATCLLLGALYVLSVVLTRSGGHGL
ncbi:MAG TPA: hypothetical protein VNO30_18685 [Kofleriaceae bacterium]|nr:hypothetical protein [Kofleriaceae bacterium]